MRRNALSTYKNFTQGILQLCVDTWKRLSSGRKYSILLGDGLEGIERR